MVYPKYYLRKFSKPIPVSGEIIWVIRGNKITGEVEFLVKDNWKSLSKLQSDFYTKLDQEADAVIARFRAPDTEANKVDITEVSN